MKVYESTGSFDPVQKTFSLDVTTTDISPDEFYISQYYNICNASRYAIVGILQTNDGNATDFSSYPPDASLILKDIAFSKLNTDYLAHGDLDIDKINTGDEIIVYIHHGIGFDPTKNTYDNKYIENYKLGTYTYYPAGSPPGAKGEGTAS